MQWDLTIQLFFVKYDRIGPTLCHILSMKLWTLKTTCSHFISLNKMNLIKSTFNTQRTIIKSIIRKTKFKLMVKLLHWASIPLLKITKSKTVLIHKKQFHTSQQKLFNQPEQIWECFTSFKVFCGWHYGNWVSDNLLQFSWTKSKTKSKQIWLAHANKLENNNLVFHKIYCLSSDNSGWQK